MEWLSKIIKGMHLSLAFDPRRKGYLKILDKSIPFTLVQGDQLRAAIADSAFFAAGGVCLVHTASNNS